MAKKLACFLVLILIGMAVVSAATEIRVKTLPLRNLSILILDASQTYYLAESFHVSSDINGKANATYSGSINKINIGVKIAQENIYDTFGPFNTGQQINLNVIPGDMSSSTGVPEEENAIENITENTTEANLTENVVSNTTSNESKKGFLSGLSISAIKGKIKIVYYVVGVILIGGLIFLYLKFGREWIKKDVAYNYKSLSSKELSKELSDAEKKLREAQEEINKLKNKDKIEAMERKIEQDKSELENLRKGKV
jgi:hypothetical protein